MNIYLDIDGVLLADIALKQKLVLELKKASPGLLQRRFSIGYARADRLLGQLEDNGVIEPFDGYNPRKVLL